MSDIDPAGVMAAHSPGHLIEGDYCRGCERLTVRETWPCEPYRLAEALAAEQAKVARVEALAARWERIAGMSDIGRGIRVALADQPEQEQQP